MVSVHSRAPTPHPPLDALLSNSFDPPRKDRSQYTVETQSNDSDDEDDDTNNNEFSVVQAFPKVKGRRASLSFAPPQSHNRTTMIRRNQPLYNDDESESSSVHSNTHSCISQSTNNQYYGAGASGLLEEAAATPSPEARIGTSKFRSKSCGFLSRKKIRKEDMNEEQLLVALVEEETEIEKRIEKEKKALKKKQRKEKEAADKAAAKAAAASGSNSSRRHGRRSSMVASTPTTTTSRSSSTDKKKDKKEDSSKKKSSSSSSTMIRSKSAETETPEEHAVRKAARRQRRASMASIPVADNDAAAIIIAPVVTTPEDDKLRKKSKKSSSSSSGKDKKSSKDDSKDKKKKSSSSSSKKENKDISGDSGAASRTVEQAKNFLRSLSPTRLSQRQRNCESPGPMSSPGGGGRRSNSPSPALLAGLVNLCSLTSLSPKPTSATDSATSVSKSPKLISELSLPLAVASSPKPKAKSKSAHPRMTVKLDEEAVNKPTESSKSSSSKKSDKKKDSKETTSKESSSSNKKESSKSIPEDSNDPVHILYLEQRKKERAERIEMARLRIKEQQAMEEQAFNKRPEDERRQAAYSWYMRLGMPPMAEFKHKVRRMHGACDIQEGDVDLLPWLPGGKRVSAKGLFSGSTASAA